jgi:hypothetical protein
MFPVLGNDTASLGVGLLTFQSIWLSPYLKHCDCSSGMILLLIVSGHKES